MTAVLALIGVLATACATLIGHWITRQRDRRLDSEARQSEERLRLDATMHAADFAGSSGSGLASSARAAAGLVALTDLGRADLAIALLVDLWSPATSSRRQMAENEENAKGQNFVGVSTEVAIQVINAALEIKDHPHTQIIAADLLCDNAKNLRITRSSHWPKSISGEWIPELPQEAKLRIIDALVLMTLAAEATENALRILTMRLYDIWALDSNQPIRGYVAALMSAIMPVLHRLAYLIFSHGNGILTLRELEEMAYHASRSPDGYLDLILVDRCERLQQWSHQCNVAPVPPGMLSTAE